MSRKYPKIVDQSGYLAKVLIVDEIGLSAIGLVSELLNQGFLVYLSTPNDREKDSLAQYRNLYLSPPKEVGQLSFIDYLVVLQKPDANNEVALSRFPCAYKTFVFRPLGTVTNELNDLDSLTKTNQSIKLILYDEVVDQHVTSKFSQLSQLNKEGTKITLNKGGNYYPITSETIGQAVVYLINHQSQHTKYWLSSKEYSWQTLIDQINSVERKTTKKVNIDIPATIIPSGLLCLNLPHVIDMFQIHKAAALPEQVKPLRPPQPPKPIWSWPTKPFSCLRKLINNIRLLTSLIIKKLPQQLVLRLLVAMLIVVNVGIVGRIALEKLAISNLNNYLQVLTQTIRDNSLTDHYYHQARRLSLWKNPPLTWFIPSSVSQSIPPTSTINALSLWLAENQRLGQLEATFIKQWLAGKPILVDDWNSLTVGYTQQASMATNLSRIVKQSATLDQLTIAPIDMTKQRFSLELWQKLVTDSPVRLLILVQNSFELRPTGGLVSAYGLLTLQSGQRPTVEFFDSSTLDVKMAGRIQPPTELTNQLGENRWFFRDIGWDPDTAITTEKAIWYFENAQKTTVDGLLLTTTDFWYNLNRLVGDDKNSDNNQFYANMVAASAAQKGTLSSGPFLAAYANETVALTASQTPYGLGKLIAKSFETKNLILNLKDISSQTLIAKLDWDGKVKDFVKPESKSEIVADYVMVNEANVGINLVNNFVDRKIDHSVFFAKTTKLTNIRLSYTNRTPTTAWPGGSYQAYLRIYLPKSVSLGSIMTNQNGDLSPIGPEKINGGQVNAKAVYGFRIEVQPGETKDYIIEYTDNGFSGENKVGTYLLLVQKQPGIGNQHYQLSITSDKALTPLRSIPDGQINNTAISVISSIEKDTIFQVDFGQ